MEVLGKFKQSIKILTRKVESSKQLSTILKDRLIELSKHTYSDIDALYDDLKIELTEKSKNAILDSLDISSDYGTLEIDFLHIHRAAFRKFLGKSLSLKISIFRKSRTGRQNRYLHGVVVPSVIEFETDRGADWVKNKTDEELIALCKANIYQGVLNYTFISETVNGRDVLIAQGKHFSEMSTVEFNNAVEIVRDYFNPLMQEFYNDTTKEIPLPQRENFYADVKQSIFRNKQNY